jgi:hypothetical protein
MRRLQCSIGVDILRTLLVLGGAAWLLLALISWHQPLELRLRIERGLPVR